MKIAVAGLGYVGLSLAGVTAKIDEVSRLSDALLPAPAGVNRFIMYIRRAPHLI